MAKLTQDEITNLEALLDRPKFRRTILQAAKEEVPTMTMPPDFQAAEEINERFDAKIKPLQETIDRLQEELAKEKKNQSWNEQLEDLKKQFAWNDKQVKEFLTEIGTEFKDGRELTLLELADYKMAKSQPLAPSGQPSGTRFLTNRGSAETRWRNDMRDPKSPLFGKNKRQKRAYLNELWQQAKEEYAATQGRTR